MSTNSIEYKEYVIKHAQQKANATGVVYYIYYDYKYNYFYFSDVLVEGTVLLTIQPK